MLKKHFLYLGVVLLTTGCGGGGNSQSTTPPPTANSIDVAETMTSDAINTIYPFGIYYSQELNLTRKHLKTEQGGETIVGEASKFNPQTGKFEQVFTTQKSPQLSAYAEWGILQDNGEWVQLPLPYRYIARQPDGSLLFEDGESIQYKYEIEKIEDLEGKSIAETLKDISLANMGLQLKGNAVFSPGAKRYIRRVTVTQTTYLAHGFDQRYSDFKSLDQLINYWRTSSTSDWWAFALLLREKTISNDGLSGSLSVLNIQYVEEFEASWKRSTISGADIIELNLPPNWSNAYIRRGDTPFLTIVNGEVHPGFKYTKGQPAKEPLSSYYLNDQATHDLEANLMVK